MKTIFLLLCIFLAACTPKLRPEDVRCCIPVTYNYNDTIKTVWENYSEADNNWIIHTPYVRLVQPKMQRAERLDWPYFQDQPYLPPLMIGEFKQKQRPVLVSPVELRDPSAFLRSIGLQNR